MIKYSTGGTTNFTTNILPDYEFYIVIDDIFKNKIIYNHKPIYHKTNIIESLEKSMIDNSDIWKELADK